VINHANRYADACRAAATMQGLDPLTAAAEHCATDLAEAGVSYDVEQTGGFTMVACFYFADQVVTCTHEGDWLVCQQARETWVDGPQPDDFTQLEVGAGATAGDVVTLVLKRATA
jgi:hypothetical protein